MTLSLQQYWKNNFINGLRHVVTFLTLGDGGWHLMRFTIMPIEYLESNIENINIKRRHLFIFSLHLRVSPPKQQIWMTLFLLSVATQLYKVSMCSKPLRRKQQTGNDKSGCIRCLSLSGVFSRSSPKIPILSLQIREGNEVLVIFVILHCDKGTHGKPGLKAFQRDITLIATTEGDDLH